MEQFLIEEAVMARYAEEQSAAEQREHARGAAREQAQAILERRKGGA